MNFRNCFPVLVLGCLLTFAGTGCKKSNDAQASGTKRLSSIYKDTLEGTWTWQHIYYIYNSNVPYTYVKVSDTTFPIVILNDSEISVLGNRMRYYDSLFYSGNIGKLNDTANNLRYSDKFALPQITKYLSFDRNNDSAKFESAYELGVGGRRGDIYATKFVH